MDYKQIMNNKEEVNFPELYEMAISNMEDSFDFPPELKNELKLKRAFGLDKYKEYSFQSSLKNTLASPTVEHLREEIVDAYNYTLHELYKKFLLGDSVGRSELRAVIDNLNNIWKIIDTIR